MTQDLSGRLLFGARQVNCAAWTARATLDSTTADVWDLMMNTNVRGPFLLVQVTLVAKLTVECALCACLLEVASLLVERNQPFS